MNPGQMLRELLRTGPGKTGAALLVVAVLLSVYVLFTFPLNFGTQVWSNPAVWSDHPKAAPPAWTNLFTGSRKPEHRILRATEPTETAPAGDGERRLYRLSFDLSETEPPTFLSLTLTRVGFHSRPSVFTVSLLRPDGAEVVLLRHTPRAPRPDENLPVTRYVDTPLREALSASTTAEASAVDLMQERYGLSLQPDDLRGRLTEALFGVPRREEPLAFAPLSGKYEMRVTALVADPADSIGGVQAVVGGGVYGFMGTDAVGRDLSMGLLFGLPIALFIGVIAALLTTVVGTGLGIVSGYVAGRTDTVIQRFADIVNNVPLLPLLIFLVFVVGSQLFLIILVLVAFSWPGLTILIRSMVLHLRTGPLVEAARSIGASPARIMARHIFPHAAPYVFAQMVFLVPGAILAEAALSFLGLGDPSLPTWGQILEAGFRTGGVYVGYWWWVVPPGLLIVLTAVTFILLALGMEPVVNPRLRRSP